MTRPIKLEHLAKCVGWWGGTTRKGRVETEVAWRVSADDVKERGYNLDIKNPHVVAAEQQDPEDSESPRTALIEGYVDALTGSSLQSVDQPDRAVAAMGISDSELRRRIRTLKPLFVARNEIVHELDLLRPQGDGPRPEESGT